VKKSSRNWPTGWIFSPKTPPHLMVDHDLRSYLILMAITAITGWSFPCFFVTQLFVSPAQQVTCFRNIVHSYVNVYQIRCVSM
jgi:hypothetical protein